MATLIEQYQSEDRPAELEQYGSRLKQISAQRKSMLATLAQAQLDEKANVDGFIANLDDTSTDQIRSENRTKMRGFARKQWRDQEIQSLSLYVTRGSINQNESSAQLLDRLIEQIAIDTGSDFATLMAAITAANTARSA